MLPFLLTVAQTLFHPAPLLDLLLQPPGMFDRFAGEGPQQEEQAGGAAKGQAEQYHGQLQQLVVDAAKELLLLLGGEQAPVGAGHRGVGEYPGSAVFAQAQQAALPLLQGFKGS